MLRFNALIWPAVSPSVSLILIHLVSSKTLWSNLGKLAFAQTNRRLWDSTVFPLCCFECVGMFVRGHVLIYLAACMCVVALEGGHRHKEKKNWHLSFGSTKCLVHTKTHKQTFRHTKNTWVINAASLRIAMLWMVTRETNTTVEQNSIELNRNGDGTEWTYSIIMRNIEKV